MGSAGTPQAPIKYVASDYSGVVHAFMELRARGASLSAMDAEILLSWRSIQVPPQLIIDAMLVLADECLAEGRAFPGVLAPIDRRVRALLKSMHEY